MNSSFLQFISQDNAADNLLYPYGKSAAAKNMTDPEGGLDKSEHNYRSPASLRDVLRNDVGDIPFLAVNCLMK